MLEIALYPLSSDFSYMKVATLLFICIMLCDCNRSLLTDPRGSHTTNPEFTPYISQFETYLGEPIGDIPINFATLDGDTIGQCIVWDNRWREIKIDPYYWNNMGEEGHIEDEDAKLSLLFHELGHCRLNRGHLNTTLDDNGRQVFTSFMNYYIFFDSSYLESKAYYINELFHPAPGYPTLGQSSGESNDTSDFIHINRDSNGTIHQEE